LNGDSMSTQSCVPQTAEILEFSAFRRRSDNTIAKSQSVTAELLSIRQNLDYRASVEIDEFNQDFSELDTSVRNRLMRDVRALLDVEFGKLRINCDKGVFQVRHRKLESLIAGLLRCQFHARQIIWTRTGAKSDEAASTGLGITWGVGDSLDEAEADRIKRRARKNSQI